MQHDIEVMKKEKQILKEQLNVHSLSIQRILLSQKATKEELENALCVKSRNSRRSQQSFFISYSSHKFVIQHKSFRLKIAHFLRHFLNSFLSRTRTQNQKLEADVKRKENLLNEVLSEVQDLK